MAVLLSNLLTLLIVVEYVKDNCGFLVANCTAYNDGNEILT